MEIICWPVDNRLKHPPHTPSSARPGAQPWASLTPSSAPVTAPPPHAATAYLCLGTWLTARPLLPTPLPLLCGPLCPLARHLSLLQHKPHASFSSLSHISPPSLRGRDPPPHMPVHTPDTDTGVHTHACWCRTRTHTQRNPGFRVCSGHRSPTAQHLHRAFAPCLGDGHRDVGNGPGAPQRVHSKAGIRISTTPSPSAPRPRSQRRGILWPLGPHWSFSKGEEGRFGRLPPPHPLACQHNIKADLK